MPRTRRTGNDRDEPAWSIPSLREPRYSQSLERGLAILGCFTPSRPVLGIADIADELGMSRSTTHRYVTTLVALGYLEQGASRKYRLGLRVTDLGMAALSSTGLGEHAHPHLEELRRQTSYTASLAVLDGEDVVLVDHVRSHRRGQRPPGLELSAGSRVPAYGTALGKALLAGLPEGERGTLISSMKLGRRGPGTITSKKALRDQLARIGRSGLAVEDQELAPKLYAIAVPVRDDAGAVTAAASLSAHGPGISLRELREALAPHLLAAADRISARLGYRRDDERG
jgi:IclR family pca regulon transcriptional regulator